MTGKLITVASCIKPIEGHLLRTRLEAEGIRCFLSILLLGIPLPLLSREWSCRRSGEVWKQKLFG